LVYSWPILGLHPFASLLLLLLLLQQHRFTYNEPMPVESCTQSLCDLALRFGEDGEEAGMVRGGQWQMQEMQQQQVQMRRRAW
jgi:hypothetical protein